VPLEIQFARCLADLTAAIALDEMLELFVRLDFSAAMPTDQGSHRRSFLRLRIFPLLGGINLYQEMAPIWFRPEKYLLRTREGSCGAER